MAMLPTLFEKVKIGLAAYGKYWVSQGLTPPDPLPAYFAENVDLGKQIMLQGVDNFVYKIMPFVQADPANLTDESDQSAVSPVVSSSMENLASATHLQVPMSVYSQVLAEHAALTARVAAVETRETAAEARLTAGGL